MINTGVILGLSLIGIGFAMTTFSSFADLKNTIRSNKQDDDNNGGQRGSVSAFDDDDKLDIAIMTILFIFETVGLFGGPLMAFVLELIFKM